MKYASLVSHNKSRVFCFSCSFWFLDVSPSIMSTLSQQTHSLIISPTAGYREETINNWSALSSSAARRSSHQVTRAEKWGARRKNKDSLGSGLWVACPWAEWDAVTMEIEPYPVPFEMSRAGAERAHKSLRLISKAVGLSVVASAATLT